MRPDPEDLRTDSDDDRIIYLGDVRRRRSARRGQQPDRHYLAALGMVALASWAVWLTVLFSLQPARLLTYLAFFAPLAVALTASATIGLYVLEWRMGRLPHLRAEMRRGALVSGTVVANLAFLAAHRWSVLVFGIAVLVCLAIEGLAARREI